MRRGVHNAQARAAGWTRLDEDEHEWTAEMLADGQRLVLEAARQRIQAVVTGRIAPDGQSSQDGSA